MLKDMTDSKRIDGHVQSQKAVGPFTDERPRVCLLTCLLQSIVHPTIISRHFWPALESSDIVMPGQFQKFVIFPFRSVILIILYLRRLQEQYAAEFTTFKPDKRLRWLPHLGTVHLELQLEDRTIETDVPPLEAAFMELFSQKCTCMLTTHVCESTYTNDATALWSMDELITAVGSIDRAAALKALLTWVDLGVLKEDTENTFRLLETAEEPSSGTRETTRAGTSFSPLCRHRCAS